MNPARDVLPEILLRQPETWRTPIPERIPGTALAAQFKSGEEGAIRHGA
jgi:hypothetical protein